jgi:catechol 2,3-dioxygenase-like lactoylglutathione lyase family enzyme
MPALGMSHMAFCVRDMAKSLAFYQEALGFRVLQDRRQDTTTGGLPHVYKHRRATRRQVALAYGEGDARPQIVMTEHPGEPPDGEPIKLDQIGISHVSFTVPSVAQCRPAVAGQGLSNLWPSRRLSGPVGPCPHRVFLRPRWYPRAVRRGQWRVRASVNRRSSLPEKEGC